MLTRKTSHDYKNLHPGIHPNNKAASEKGHVREAEGGSNVIAQTLRNTWKNVIALKGKYALGPTHPSFPALECSAVRMVNIVPKDLGLGGCLRDRARSILRGG